MQKIILSLVAAFVIVIAAGLAYSSTAKPLPKDSQPTPTISTSPTPTNAMILTSPQTNQIIKSPLQITGSAPGNWFFEAVAPVKLVDIQGNVLATGQIRTTDNWQTTNPVSFTGTLTFTKPKNAKGTLIFSKDNPSGLPENNQQYVLPVRFQ